MLGRALLPAWEAWRGRPTYQLLAYLQTSQWRSLDELSALQAGLLRRLVRHATQHSPYYREAFASVGVSPADIRDAADIGKLPLLTRAIAQQSFESRIADFPPIAVHKATSGTTGQPVKIAYNASSRHWRDAMRWRGYGWGGYQPGMRALHFWGQMYRQAKGLQKLKSDADHFLRNDTYVDCGPRAPDDLRNVVSIIRQKRPEVIVAYAQGAAALARFVNATGARTWDDIPVIVGAEKLWEADRHELVNAFGARVSETYGSREFMLMGTECEAHDGFHASMETQVLEILVTDKDGVRPAAPGEHGEVTITDLTNLACPFIRYVTGDIAIARPSDRCSCGRALVRFGPVDGRISETLRNRRGEAVNGLTFGVAMVELANHVQQFQVHQHGNGDVTLRIVETSVGLTDEAERILRAHVERYLPGTPLTIARVPEIPLTSTGKRRVVIVDPPT